MKTTYNAVSDRIKYFRKSKKLTQAELDQMAKLPISTTSKIENKKREATAEELVRISRSLGISLNAFSAREESYIYADEVKIIEALREIPFEDYKQLIRTLESQVYFAAKDTSEKRKKYLQDLVMYLSNMTTIDQRPRGAFDKDVERIRK